MKKRTLGRIGSVLMAGAMVVSLAACGGGDSSSTATTAAAGGTETTAAAAGTTAAAETTAAAAEEETAAAEDGGAVAGALSNYEAKDMGGRTIKIGLWWDIFYDSEFQTLDDITAAGGTYDNAETAQMQLDAVRAVEDKWNVKIDYVNLGWDGVISSINTSVTNGTPDCDIYLTDPQFGIPAVANGYAMNLEDVAPADSDILNEENVFTRFPVLGNENYLFYTSTTVPTGAVYLAYNADMVDEMGLEAPEALAERGEWTWDKFAEYCQTLTRDTDGDGNMDVYGYGTTQTKTMQGFLASNNAMIAGTTTEGLSDPKSIEAFNFIDRLYNVDGTARPYTTDWNDDNEALFQNKVAFGFVQFYELVGRDIDYEVRICPAPIGPSGDGSMTPNELHNCYFIPVGVEDATAVYEIFEELNNWHMGDTFYRDDPAWFESGFVDEDQLELGYTEGYKANADIFNSVSNNPMGDVWYAIYVNKEMSVSQAIESYKQQMQDAIDALSANME